MSYDNDYSRHGQGLGRTNVNRYPWHAKDPQPTMSLHGFYCPDDLWQRLREHSRRHRHAIAWVIREAVHEYLINHSSGL